jgi:hypothetical protein
MFRAVFMMGSASVVIGVTGIVLTGFGSQRFKRIAGGVAEYAIRVGVALIAGSGLVA